MNRLHHLILPPTMLLAVLPLRTALSAGYGGSSDTSEAPKCFVKTLGNVARAKGIIDSST